MGKPFEVKEFDSIICNADYKDDEKYKYLNQKEFENLVAFIHEFTGDADSADALDFRRLDSNEEWFPDSGTSKDIVWRGR